MIKLIAIDLDGTFLDSNKQIIFDNRNAIQQAIAQGVKVVICTGRTLPGVRHLLEELPFFHEGDYLVLQNGASAHQLPSLAIAFEETISMDVKNGALQLLDAVQDLSVQLVAFDTDNMYLIEADAPNHYVAKDAEALFTPITSMTRETFLSHQILNKAMMLGPKVELDQVMSRIPQALSQNASIVRSQPIIVEFLPQNVTKRSALERLVNELGLESTSVMAIGDQLNDMEMLAYAGIGVAMGNAVDTVKEISDFVTKSNDDAGVAYAIEKFVLNK